MKLNSYFSILCGSILLTSVTVLATAHVDSSNDSAAAEAAKPNPVVKYKAGKDLNFEQLVIEGQLKRPELSVVTGDNDENGNGLLRLRENFIDRIEAQAGEEAQ